ncbi:MAG: N-acetyltransferase [Oscillospiraceae bacterium]|nr:N-acetyltransferase [Oscillospiraceae bacterium]
MAGYKIIALRDMVAMLGEDRAKSILASYSCPINPDVEGFLRDKAIEFDRQGLSATHLVFTSYRDQTVLAGYYTLALKIITISEKKISNTIRRKLIKYASRDQSMKCFNIPAPLIAQLGKNYTHSYNKLITGDELLKLACEKVAQIQQAAGGKVVYLECEDIPKLISFYSDNGFCDFGKRMLERDEIENQTGNYYVQMLKIIKIDT